MYRRSGWKNVLTFVLSLVMVLQNLLSPVRLAFADEGGKLGRH